MVLAHGVLVRVNASFDRVVGTLKPGREYSNVYIEVFDTKPRVAIAIGEKFFFRAGNYASITLILIEEDNSTIIRAIASGSRKGPLDFTDLGVSKDYVKDSINTICELARATCEIIREVEHLDASRSELLRI
ncbi:MAG: DUF6054 family protein [Desulfurococcaceae archaeon]